MSDADDFEHIEAVAFLECWMETWAERGADLDAVRMALVEALMRSLTAEKGLVGAMRAMSLFQVMLCEHAELFDGSEPLEVSMLN